MTKHTEEQLRQMELAKHPSKIQKEIDAHGWRDIARELRALGFTPSPDHGVTGDFIARQDMDGKGPYIFMWLSKEPCPFPEMIREPTKPEPVKPEE